MKPSALLKSQAEWLSAIAEPTRVAIIRALASGERSVTELAKLVGVEIPSASQHLRVLKDGGMVADKRDGRSIYYSLLGATATATEIVLTHESGAMVTLALHSEKPEKPALTGKPKK